MARYGEKYYTDLPSLYIGLEKGLGQAFELTCQDLLEEIKDITLEDIYSYVPIFYERTDDLKDAWTYESVGSVKGTQLAEFKIDTSKLTEGNPQHHFLRQGKDGEYYYKNLLDDHNRHGRYQDDIEFMIKSKFIKYYQKNCKLLGISLEGD